MTQMGDPIGPIDSTAIETDVVGVDSGRTVGGGRGRYGGDLVERPIALGGRRKAVAVVALGALQGGYLRRFTPQTFQR
jgi:hypothetical protein